MTQQRILLASSFYAQSQGLECSGDQQCHWCSSPCGQSWRHDEPAPLQGYKSSSTARRPASHWCCVGCWLWRRLRISIRFLSGGYKDGQSPLAWSWLILPREAFALRPQDGEALYEFLLAPSRPFCLTLLDVPAAVNGSKPPTVPLRNHIHLAAMADPSGDIKADTALPFTVNNISHSMQIYSLQETLRCGSAAGKGPGEAALTRLFGFARPANLPPPTDDMLGKNSGRENKGRPVQGRENNPHRTVVASGQASGKR